MGHGYHLKCGNCNAQEFLYLGRGQVFIHLNVLLNMIEPPEERDVIRGLLEFDGPVRGDSDRRLYTCPQCKTVEARLHLLILHGFKEPGAPPTIRVYGEVFSEIRFRKVYRTRHRCYRCRSVLAGVREGDWNAYRCQSCGEKRLKNAMGKSSTTFGWD
jgi:hypothetical protein